MTLPEKPVSRLCRYSETAIHYGDDNLVEDLIGQASFVDVFVKQSFAKTCTAAERRMIEAVLITLMEHGLTPSAIAARLIYSSSPETLQAGVAAGLLAVGSRFVGTMEEAAQHLNDIVAAGADGEAAAARLAEAFRSQRKPVPGFGHHLHKPDDPRALRLLELSRQTGIAGAHQSALMQLAAAVDATAGRHITINATGAVAAILGDIGIPARLMRGVAVLARTAGLLAHIREEQQSPSDRFIWDLVDRSMTDNAGQ